MRRAKLMTAALVGVAILLVGGVAWGNHLSVSSRTFREVFRSISFEGEILGTIRCPVTMEGSLHSATFAKTAGALIGYINRASLTESACTGGSATLAQESLPWHEQYSGFEGTLPNISRTIRVALGARIIMVFGGSVCIYIGNEGANGFSITLVREAGGRITGLRFSGSVRPEPSNPPVCPRVVRVAAEEGTETVAGSTASITVTLI